jgi:hypothetical protein
MAERKQENGIRKGSKDEQTTEKAEKPRMEVRNKAQKPRRNNLTLLQDIDDIVQVMN